MAALNRVSLTIPSGVFGILGPNGAGKTTLFRILATVAEPTEGSFSIGDVDASADPQAIRRYIGYLPQEISFFRSLKPFEHLEWVAAMKGIPSQQRKRAVEEVLTQVNLTGHAAKQIGALSGGMRRRLGIAQALLGEPPVLLLDEPTAGLDLEEQINIRNLLASLGTERTILLSSHVVADLDSTCRRLAIMHKGRVVFSGDRTALLQAAQGKLWQLVASRPDYETLRGQYRVLSAREGDGGMVIRLVAEQAPPASSAVPVAPGLEDAYLYHLGLDPS